jgi:hypothetical protein
MGLAYNRVNMLKARKKKKTEKHKILFSHTMGTTIFNDYLIFTKKTGGILQLTDKQEAYCNILTNRRHTATY